MMIWNKPEVLNLLLQKLFFSLVLSFLFVEILLADSATDEHRHSFTDRRKAIYDEFRRLQELKSVMNNELLSDEERDIEIDGGGDSLITIEIEDSVETAQDVEIL